MGNDELSPIKRAALSLLDHLKNMVVSDCSDEDIAKSMVKFHPMSDLDYINPNDYCSYDEALKELGLGYNRNKLNSLCKKHGVKNHKIKNSPLGFKISDIQKLKQYIK